MKTEFMATEGSLNPGVSRGTLVEKGNSFTKSDDKAVNDKSLVLLSIL